MKTRFFALLLAAVMLLTLFPVGSASAAEATVTVYFRNDWLWEDVCIHYWSDTDSSLKTTWPGTAMTLVETDDQGHEIYSAQVPAAATGIVFNGIKDDGSGNRDQSPDITSIQTGVCYYMVWDNGNSYATEEYTPAPDGDDTCEHSYEAVVTAPTCTQRGYTTYTCTLCSGSYVGDYVAATGHTISGGVCATCGYAQRTIYFDNTADWSTVNIYYWSDANSQMMTWPGVAMELGEDGYYSYLIPAEAQYVIFNNGTEQTADLTIPETDNLYSDGSWSYYSTCTHDWGEGTVTTDATCTTDGVRTYTCSGCGEKKTEVISATGHSYSDGVCSNCGALAECTEHVWDEGVVTVEPGCWTFGTRTYTCTACKATKTENIYPGHDIYVAETVAPTCTATGKEITKCTRCAYSYSKTLPKIDHSYDIAGETVAATCTTDGYTVYSCSGCGAQANKDIVYHTGHSWDGNTCTVCGEVCEHSYADGICSSCHKGGPAYVEGFYEIANAAQLYWFAAQVNGGNNAINGKLIADIDLQDGSWISIGYYCSDTLEPDTMPYTGTFDGQGHTVSNFVTAGTDNEGLFGYCSSATIKNVGVVNARVTGWRAGAVAGYPLTSNVLNCFAKDCVITGNTTNSVATLSGTVYIAPIASPQGGIIRDCYAVNCTLIDNTDLAVETSPVGGTDTQNGYYYNTVYSGDFTSVRNSTEVTLEQLASGEVTYLLNKGVTDGTQGWYQTCGTGMPAHAGQTVYLSSGCGSASNSYTNDPNATEHSYEGVVTAPTCEDAGYTTYTCSKCGDSYVADKVAAAGHSYDAVVTVPTCKDGGFTTYTCSVCSDSYVADEVPAADHSYVDGTCTACGEADPDYVAPTVIPTIKLNRGSATFEDEVYVSIYSTITDVDDIVFVGLLTSEDDVVDENDTYITAYDYKVSDSTYVVRSHGIPAKKLNEDIYFKVYALLSDGTYAYSRQYHYSPKDYAMDRLANSTDANLKALCVAMLNYGAAAQTYFGYNTDNLANADLTDEQKALVNAYDSTMVNGVTAADSAKIGEFANTQGYSSRKPSVSFEGAFSISYYLTPKTENTPENGVTLYYWTKETYDSVDVLTRENADGVIITELYGTAYKGTVAGIAAKEIDQPIYAAGVYECDGVTYATGVMVYSLGAYCVDRIANGSAEMKPLAEATAVYGYYAKQYFAV